MGLDTEGITAALPAISKVQQQHSKWMEVSLARQLWQQIFTFTRDEAIGFKVGMCLSIRAFGVLAPVLSHSPTIADALQNMLRYQQLLSQSGRFVSELDGNKLTLHYRPADSHIAIHYTQIDSVVTAFVKALRLLLGEWVTVKSIAVTGPERKEGQLYREFFQCPVEFNAAKSRLTLLLPSIDQELLNSDPHVYSLNKSLAEDRLWQLNNSEQLQASVGEVIAKVGYVQANLPLVAEQLGLSNRTLQRKLQLSGCSFRQLQEQQILKQVTYLLMETRLSMHDIAHQVGYTESSSFSRAIKKLTGQSPAYIRHTNK